MSRWRRQVGVAAAVAVVVVVQAMMGISVVPARAIPGSLTVDAVLVDNSTNPTAFPGNLVTIEAIVTQTQPACDAREVPFNVSWLLDPPDTTFWGVFSQFETDDGQLDGCPSATGDHVSRGWLTLGWSLGLHTLCVRALDVDDTTPWDDGEAPPLNSCVTIDLNGTGGPLATATDVVPPIFPGGPMTVDANVDDTLRGGKDVVAAWMRFDDNTTGCAPPSVPMTPVDPLGPVRNYTWSGASPLSIGMHVAYVWGEDADGYCTGDIAGDPPGEIFFFVSTDAGPPLATADSAVPNPVEINTPVTFRFTADDRTMGNSLLQDAELTIDQTPPSPFWGEPGTQAMAPCDGAADSALEDFCLTLPATWGVGAHMATMRGRDALGNFGNTGSYYIDVAFDVVPPGTPANLWANLANGPAWNDVVLTWVPSTSPNIQRQEACWGPAYDATANSYTNCVNLPTTAATHTFAGQGDGDPADYFYVVKAVFPGNIYTFSNQAGKFTRPVANGWHLVSTPLVPQSTDPTVVLRTLTDRLEAAQTYVCADPNDPWKSWVPAKPGRDFVTMDHRIGVWVKLNAADTFTTAGRIPTSTDVALCAGWNMIGFPSYHTAYTAGDFRAGTGATKVQTSNPSGNGRLVNVADSTPLAAGTGYWVKMPTAATWTIGQP